MFPKKRFSSFRFARYIPLPVLSMLIGLLSGLMVWVMLDHIQSRSLNSIFMMELTSQLKQRAWENQRQFEQRMDHHILVAHMLADQWLFNKNKYTNTAEMKDWLDELSWLGRGLSPSYVLIVGDEDEIEHLFASHEKKLSRSALERIVGALSSSPGAKVYAAPDGQPYLLVTEDLPRENDVPGRLILLTPIDVAFLNISHRGDDFSGTILALLDEDGETILVSSDDLRILSGTTVNQWQDDYVITSRRISKHRPTDQRLEIATFVPHATMMAMSQRIVAFERRQRIIGAFVFVVTFTLVMVLVSSWVIRILRRISHFARGALAVDHPVTERGNKLILLEEWIRDFILVIKKTRDELRREHEARLHDIQAINAAVLKSSTDLIITIDEWGKISEFNPRVEKAFGYRNEEVEKSDFCSLLVLRSDQERFKTLLQACRNDLEQADTLAGEELRMVRSDNSVFPAEVAIIPVILEERLLFTISLHDITKRKIAEQEIQSLARFASENPSPLLRIDDQGIVVYANDAGLPLLDHWQCGISEKLSDNWIEKLLLPLKNNQTSELELTCGERIYSLLLAPVIEQGYVNIYGRDITEVQLAEQQSRQHQTELVHVCRVSTMGEMSTGLAHELNQPLAAIMNFANGCVRRLKNGPMQESELIGALDQISLQADRAGEIIRRLRNLVRKKPPERSLVDMNTLVREVCSFVEYDSTKMGLKINLELTSEPLMLRVDFVQIEQVLLNLVRNALDAMKDTPREYRLLSIETASKEGHSIMVSVRDTGPGMDSDTISHLFDAFFSTKETGMGMGLPISKSIIDDHKGTITVDSVPGKGTQFVITLPTGAKQEEQS